MPLVIIDFNRTLYDPDTEKLMEGADELLQRLSRRNISMVLVSRREGAREEILSAFGISPMFNEVIFCEEKTDSLFREIIANYGQKENFVIGDYLYQEIRAGNQAGATTIHFKKGKFADIEPTGDMDVPDHTIDFLPSALRYII